MPPAMSAGGMTHDAEAGPAADPRPASGKRALIVVDVQNDFVTGSLAVKDAESIVDPVNRLLRGGHFDVVVYSRDAHPAGHVSFASAHFGGKPFTTAKIRNPRAGAATKTTASGRRNPSSAEPTFVMQDLWPDHCVRGTKGWEFHPNLDVSHADVVIDKGDRRNTDSYSAFFRAVASDPFTVLGRELAARGVSKVYCVGLAYDYCVGATALDAAAEGFTSFVIDSLVKGVAPDTCAAMKARLERAGVAIIDKFEG
mmetsp:Transcript_23429/g.61346  ORF Transcript_23429/g.61346 Transcript_23429/m.61346 type:complete len:255 (+) Transcript_23429:282-1046(+)